MAEDSIKHRVSNSVIWTIASRFGTQALHFITMVVMARLLEPGDIGLMSICLIYMQFFDNFIDAGFQQAIIQAPYLDRKLLNSCFLFLLGIVAIGYIITFAIAPVFAHYFNELSLIELVRIIGLVLFLVPLRVVPVAILSRELQVDKLGKVEFLASIMRSLISILLALMGFGVWSLIYGYVSARITIAMLTLYLSRWKPSLQFDFSKVKSIFEFGIKILISRIIWYFQFRIDLIIVGRVLGVEALGIYSIARQIFDQLQMLIGAIYNRVIFPLFSRYNNENKDFRPLLLNIIKVSSVMVFPLFFFFSSTADHIINFVFGPKWSGATVIMIFLGYIGGFRIINLISPTAINAIGRPGITIWFNILQFAVLTVSFYLGAFYYNLLGISIAWLIYPVIFFIIQYVSMHVLKIPSVDYLKNIFTPFLFGAVLYILIDFLNSHLVFDSQLLHLILLTIITMFFFGTGLLTIFKNEMLYVYSMITSK